jgi:hypothetical protein
LKLAADTDLDEYEKDSSVEDKEAAALQEE